MKIFNKSLLLFAIALATVSIYTSCTKDNESNSGEPRINYVRVTNPVSADSLLIGAGQGMLIAIVG